MMKVRDGRIDDRSGSICVIKIVPRDETGRYVRGEIVVGQNVVGRNVVDNALMMQ